MLGAIARPNLPPIVPYTLVVLGVYITYSAMRNVSPVDELRAAIRGTPTARALNPAAGKIVGPIATPTTSPGAPPPPGAPRATIGNCTTPTDLVALPYNPALKVTADTAAKFARWCAAFGQPIPVTNSYRTCQYQAQLHDSDPNRYGTPQGSAHTKGKAVDVNLPALDATYTGNPAQKARYVKLWTTGQQSGFFAAAYRIDQAPNFVKPGRKPEPWHFATEWA